MKLKKLLTYSILSIIIAPFIIFFLIWSWVTLNYLPNQLAENKLEKTADQTEDVQILAVSCEDITFTVTTYDYIKNDLRALGDSPDIRPEILQDQRLIASQNEKVLFDVSIQNQYSPYINYSVDLPIVKGDYFVINKNEFIKLNQQPAFYRGAVIVFEAGNGLSVDSVKRLAECYKENVDSIDNAWQKKLAAFVYIQQRNARQGMTFECPDGNDIVLETSGYTRLNGITKDIIGIAGIDGEFYPYTWKKDDIGVSKEAVDLRTSEDLALCKNTENILFLDFVRTKAENVHYLD